MKIFRTTYLLILAIILAPSLGVAKPLNVAMIDMKKVFTEYQVTKDAEAENKVDRERMQKDDQEREAPMKALEEELKKSEQQLKDPTIATEKKKEIAKSYEERRQTLIALAKERQEFSKSRSAAMSEKMMGVMKKIRKQVDEVVTKFAKEKDYDYVFDSSGMTTSQVPFLLYMRDKVDITEDILNILNKKNVSK